MEERIVVVFKELGVGGDDVVVVVGISDHRWYKS